jgi:uncharacterized protein (TIGR02118 family)
MIVRTGVLRRRPDMDLDTFKRHWRDQHGPLAAKMPGLRRYEQNLVIDRSQLAIDHARGGWNVDGFSQLWFDDIEAMRATTKTPEFAPTVPDIDRFVGEIKLVVCQPNVVVPLKQDPGSLIKRMSILRRRPDIDAARFRDEWFGFHAEAVSRFPGLAGYTQNLVIDRGSDLFNSAPYEEVPIDGIVEMWFPNQASLEFAFRSREADVSQRHALDFIAEITTFLVENYRVV